MPLVMSDGEVARLVMIMLLPLMILLSQVRGKIMMMGLVTMFEVAFVWS